MQKGSSTSAGSAATATVTLAIPADALRVVAPAPALISPDIGAEHVGLTRSALADVLRAMRADPEYAARVIVLSRKRVAAAPADVVAYLRARYSAATVAVESASGDAGESAPASGVDAVLEAIGAERVRPLRRTGARAR